MTKTFEVRWQRETDAAPDAVWDAITRPPNGWLWPIEYEPRLGGAERGLTQAGGTVTAWEPARHFQTRAGDNQIDYWLRATATRVGYAHSGALVLESYDLELDACEQHTHFYAHSFMDICATSPAATPRTSAPTAHPRRRRSARG